MKTDAFDKIIFSPNDIDLKYSPLQRQLNLNTYILGAFNPGMIRIANGNLLIMVRVAEALSEKVVDNQYQAIRWSENEGFIIDKIPLELLETSDPRKYRFNNYDNTTYCLTSFSWLLPVELNESGSDIIRIHYDKIITPEKTYQEFGIEDARITKIDDIYWMTVCSVSSSRHSTVLYSSDDGLNYRLKGVILDHQNKDMVLFPKRINGLYYALTRPTGDHYFSTSSDSKSIPGPSINMAKSPDLLHWKPVEEFSIQPRKNSLLSGKAGGGAPPIETETGWLVLFHGVELNDGVGIYRTFYCLLDKNNPDKILYINYDDPILESNDELFKKLKLTKYVNEVVFTCGIEEYKDNFVIASGELDLCCRITHIPKNIFNINK